MATLIKLKRSNLTAVPASLNEGEPAYSENSNKLFIGANGGLDVHTVGGKFFTDMLDHTAGVLTASSALIVDASSKLDNLKVDNLDLNLNTISTTDVNGDLILSPNGTGDIDVSSSKIINVSTPTAPSDAANKSYVDGVVSGLDVKQSVRAASTASIADLSSFSVIQDGVTLVAGDRFLVKDGASADGIEGVSDKRNGIYVVGTVTTGTAPLTRSTDADTDAEVTAGLFTFVEEGTANGDAGWVLTTDNPITVDTTLLTFTQFSGAGQVTAGDGLNKVGNTLSVDVTDLIGAGLAEDGGNNLIIATDGVNETHIELSNNASLIGRNALDTADVEMIKVNTSDGVDLPNGATSLAALDMNTTNKIINLADPTAAQDAATKAYVDAQVAGVNQLGELTDVTLTTPAGGDLLIFTGTGDNSVNKAMSGDATIDANGVLTIGTGAVSNANLANSSITISDGSATDPVSLGETFTIAGADGITTTMAANTLTIGVGTIGVADGGTGLTALGTAGQVLQVNAGGTALVYDDIDGGTF